MNNKKEWIVPLRAFACIAIIMIHVIDGWTASANVQLTEGRYILDEIIIQPFIRWGVPVFIMISGSLLLDPTKDLSIGKIIVYIKRKLYVLVTFVFCYCIIEAIFKFGFSDLWKVFTISVVNLLQGKSWAAMWYLYMLMGLYVITPLLRPFVKDSSKEEMRFVILGLMLFTLVIPTINSIVGINVTTFYLSGFNYLLLYLSGYAIANHYFNENTIYVFGAMGLIGYLLCSVFGVLVGDQSGIFIVWFSASIFCFFSNNHYKYNINKSIEVISNDSFGIYLVHTFWLNILNKGAHVFPDVLPIGIGEIVFLISTLILSIISVEILKRFPFFRRIL